MSEKQHLFPDGSAKLSEEDKTETDSGFLSSGNLLVSGEISGEQQTQSKTIDDDDADGDKLDKSYMHIDSGVDVCLSETFSSLSLKHPDLNDLNSKGGVKDHQRQQQHQPNTKTTAEEQPWQIYFEQDEDGDT